MRLIKNFTLMMVLLPIVAACSYVDLEEIGGMEVRHWEFAQNLHKEYVGLAQAEWDEGDYTDANFFGNKAIAAADAANEGATIPDPQEVSEREIPAGDVDVLSNVRASLMEQLDNGRRTMPGHAARAQAMFDCWLQEIEENIQPDDVARCRDGFNLAFLELIKGAPAPMAAAAPSGEAIKTVGPFMVYFGFNSASLDSAANALIDSLANHKFSNDELGYIVLSGHADRAGNTGYNEALADRRVMAVSDAFMAKGVKARVLSSAYGETRPMQATADGAREPKNRRVEITLSR